VIQFLTSNASTELRSYFDPFLYFSVELKTIPSILIFLFTTVLSSAQVSPGVWISSHDLRVGTYLDLEGLDDRMVPFLKSMFVEDSVYLEGSIVLNVDSSGSARLLRDIRSDFIEDQDSLSLQKFVFVRDTFGLKTVSPSKILLIRHFTDSIWYESHFYRIPDSDLNPDDLDLAIPKKGGQLQLHVTDTTDRSYQLDFLDHRQVIITGAKDGMPYTLRGTWHSRWVGNILLFTFFDNHFQGMQLYYFLADSANALLGGSYNDAATMQRVPQQLEVVLTPSTAQDTVDIGKMRNDLIGTWRAINDPLFYDPAIEFGFLSYQSFEVEFQSDSTYRMLKSGSILKNGDSIPLEETSKGKWEVSTTGRYIVLHPADDIPLYFTIEKATADELDVHYFMKTLSEFPNYNVFENRRVEFRK